MFETDFTSGLSNTYKIVEVDEKKHLFTTIVIASTSSVIQDQFTKTRKEEVWPFTNQFGESPHGIISIKPNANGFIKALLKFKSITRGSL